MSTKKSKHSKTYYMYIILKIISKLIFVGTACVFIYGSATHNWVPFSFGLVGYMMCMLLSILLDDMLYDLIMRGEK